MKHDEEKQIYNHEIKNCLKIIQFLSESTDDYLFLWNFRTGRIYFSGNIYEKYALGKSGDYASTIEDWEKIVYARDLPLVRERLRRIMAGETDIHNMEYRLIDREGKRVWISCRGKSRMNQNGQPEMMIGRVSDTAMSRRVDMLTGLLNAEQFTEDMKVCMEQKKQGYVIILGIDNFKNINIKYGRDYGNHVLKKVTDIIEHVIDASLSIYRLDGDRYAVNMENRSRQEVEEMYREIQEKTAVHCTLSAGAVFYNDEAVEDSGILYQYAEDALDRAKQMGKNKLIFFSAEDYEKNLTMIDLLDELRYSVKHDFEGFSLCYQPQIDGVSYDIYGVEVLLRYDSPGRGDISPEEFIPILEQTELIVPVGEWVLETALAQCKIWREHLPKLHISVNLSYIQLQREEVCAKMVELLEQTDVPGDALTLEMTESVQLQNYQYVNKIFHLWKKYGIDIAIDDFGTGYSSLGYFRNLEANEVKIDRCFINQIQHSAYNYRLTSNMIKLARSAQIRVCCEGIETEEELIILKEMQPDLLQGYLFARPYRAEEFEAHYICPDHPLYQKRQQREEHFRKLYAAKERKVSQQTGKEELGIIAESMDEMIYVSDVDTYELYYMNPAGRVLAGVHDYRKRKCYQVLHGRNEPCEFCTNHKLRADSFYVWEYDNAFLNRHFMLKDKLILWKGRMARMEIAIDITEKEHIRQKIQPLLECEPDIAACTRMLLQEDDKNDAVNRALQFLGEFYKADRTYIFEQKKDGKFWNNTYEWCREYVMPRKVDFQNVPSEAVQRWMDNFPKEEPIVLWDFNSIQKNSLRECERLHTQKIRRALIIPVWKDKKMVGFLGVDNPKRCHVEDDQIHALIYILADGIWQNEDKVRLSELLESEREDTLKSIRLGLWAICIDRRTGYGEMYGDRIMRAMIGASDDLTAQGLYRYWHGRVCCHGDVDRFIEQMTASRQITQTEYIWDHPELGAVKMRCLGRYVEEKDGVACLEGYQRMICKTDIPGTLLHEPPKVQGYVEQEYRQNKKFYEALLSETEAFAEVDIETEELMAAGGLWKSYKEECCQDGLTFRQVLEKHMEENVPSEERERCQIFIEEKLCNRGKDKKSKNQKLCFQRIVKGNRKWMELVIHVFREEYTDKIYALLYMKDVDRDKKREIRLEREANLDPLTNVYNRRTFEYKVRRYMTEKAAGKNGAMVILDLDNFKATNDFYGHIKGDLALKTLTGILTKTFCEGDLIGRLGGDEFLVFMKGVKNKRILNQRMDQMFQELHRLQEIPMTCSVGIAFTAQQGFSYTKILEQADRAMYESKKRGKNQYCYYDELAHL